MKKVAIDDMELGNLMFGNSRKEWLEGNRIWFDHKKKPFYKLSHEIPSWNRKDDFLLCDDCAEEFNQWMLEKKSTNS